MEGEKDEVRNKKETEEEEEILVREKQYTLK